MAEFLNDKQQAIAAEMNMSNVARAMPKKHLGRWFVSYIVWTIYLGSSLMWLYTCTATWREAAV